MNGPGSSPNRPRGKSQSPKPTGDAEGKRRLAPRRKPTVRVSPTPETRGPNTLPPVEPTMLTQDARTAQSAPPPTRMGFDVDSVVDVPASPISTDGQSTPRQRAGTRARAKGGSTVRQPGSRPIVRSASGLGNFALTAAKGEKYRFLGELGRGGIGVVQAAEDVALRRDLAVKFLHDPENPHIQAKFIEEAQITGQLQHPNIVPIYELGVDPAGRPFMAMKRIHGRTLREVISDAHRRGKISEAAANRQLRRLLEIYLKACDAAAYAHSRGVIHRDLKPENVMVGEFGEVLVVDWGLAKPIGAPDEEIPGDRQVMSDRRAGGGPVSMDGVIVGTIPYMPPEQAAGMSSKLDEGADIYALGGILYTILTDTIPFPGEEDVEVLAAVIEGNLEPPSVRAPDARVPRELEAVVMKAMARRRNQRYATVTDLQADIESYLEGKTLTAAEYTSWQLLAKWAQRNKVALAGMIAVLLTMMVSIGVIVAVIKQGEIRQKDLDFEKLEAQRAARENELRMLAQSGELDLLKEQLGVNLQFSRDRAIDEFKGLYADAQAAGKSQDQFFKDLNERDVRRYIRAFEAVIDASEQYGQKFYTAEDFNYLGVLYSGGLKQFDKAREYYTRAIADDPTFVKGYNNRGILAIEMGKPAEGIDDLTKAIDLDPQDGGGYGNRAAAYIFMRDIEKARRDLDKAVKLKPDDPLLRLNRGKLYRHAGDQTEALREFTEAIRLNPKNSAPYYERGMVHKARGDVPAAIDDFTRAIQFEGTDDVSATVAMALFERGELRAKNDDFAGALEDFSLSIDRRVDPQTGSFLVGLGAGDFEFKSALYARAMIYGQMGLLDGAIRDLQRLYELDSNFRPRLKMQLVGAYADQSMKLIEAEKFAEALAKLDAAIKILPEESELYDRRGLCRAQLKDIAGAKRDLNDALRLKPDNWGAWFRMGLVCANAGEFREARDALLQARRYCDEPSAKPQIEQLLRRIEADLNREH